MSDLIRGFEKLEMGLEAAQLAEFTMHLAELATKMIDYNYTVRPDNNRPSASFTWPEIVVFANILGDSYLVDLFDTDLTPLAYRLMPPSGNHLTTAAERQTYTVAQHYLCQRERMMNMRAEFVRNLERHMGIGPDPVARRGGGQDVELLSDGAYNLYTYEIQKQIMTKSFEKTKARYGNSPSRWYHPERGVIYFEGV